VKVLIIYCHPNENSFTAAVRDLVVNKLEEKGIEYQLTNLYQEGFEPHIHKTELETYLDPQVNQSYVKHHVQNVLWCDTLIFIYPTWWYGLPAMLKGWMDRVLLPGVAFHMPTNNERIKPGLRHINRLGLFTSGGATWFVTLLMGSPGKKTILRAIRSLCHPRTKTAFISHYQMDSSTHESRRYHLKKVEQKLGKLIR